MANRETDLSDRLAVADEALRDFCSEIERLTGEAIDCIRWEVLRHPDKSFFYYRLCGSGREYWNYSLAEALALARKRWPGPTPAVDPDPKLTSDAKAKEKPLMLLAFTLSMLPKSWDGHWFGEDCPHCLVRSFGGAKAQQILAAQPYHYSWSDGWGARIDVSEVNKSEAARLRRKSSGFCGYDWMVDSIVSYGVPMAAHEVKKFLEESAVPRPTTLTSDAKETS